MRNLASIALRVILFRWVQLVGLILMVLAPGAFLYLAPVLLVCALPYYFTNGKIHREVFALFLFLIVLGCVVVGINIVKLGSLEGVGYWILGPLIWLVIVNQLIHARFREHLLDRVLVVAGWAVAVTNLGYLGLFLAGVLGNVSLRPIFSAHFGIDDRGFIAYSTSCLPQIGFLFPYLALRYLALRRGGLVLLLLGVAGVLSLRVAIVIVIALFGIYALVRSWKTNAWAAAIGFAALSVMVVSATLLVPPDVTHGIFELKLADKLTGQDLRIEQALFWITSFAESPITGHGIASTQLEIFDLANGELIQERYGPVVNPYGYEIFMLKTLSDIGLLVVPYVLIYWYLAFVLRTHVIATWMPTALRISALAMFLQSQTNSYLGTSGWMFVLMFPAMLAATSGLPRPIVSSEPIPSAR
jgi:hypothetical protein